jgi:hypothetical protein
LSPAVASAAVSTLKVVFCLALVCLYAAIAVAVLKYRLYDIDRVISRTLAYAIVTGVLAAVYAGLVLLATQVRGSHNPAHHLSFRSPSGASPETNRMLARTRHPELADSCSKPSCARGTARRTD